MSAARLLLVVDPNFPLEPVLRAARLVAPGAGLTVVALFEEETGHREGLATGLASLDLALADQGGATVEVAYEASACLAAATRCRADLVVVGPWLTRSPRARALTLLELARAGRDVVSVGRGCPTGGDGTGLVGVALDDAASLGTICEVVRALPRCAEVLAFVPVDAAHLADAARALLPGLHVEACPLPWSALERAAVVEAAAAARGVDLLVLSPEGTASLAAVAEGLLAATTLDGAARPTFIAHARREDAGLLGATLHASDTVRLPGLTSPVLLERAGPLGRVALGDDETLLLGGEGDLLPHLDGVVRLPLGTTSERLTTLALTTPTGAAPALCRAVDGARALVLVDAALDDATVLGLEPLAAEHELVFVRLRRDAGLADLRARLDATAPWGPVLLLDASAWLDDEGAIDVPRSVDPLRLGRLATRLRALGARVEGVATKGEHPLTTALSVFTPHALEARVATHTAPPPPGEPLAEVVGARPVPGNRVQLEWDNGAARRALLDGAARARHSLHLQSYIFEDDATVAQLVEALGQAAARGVTVRVLADALYSLHQAFGASNQVLERLAAAGVEVRAYQPFSGTPTLNDLKQRNHRKLVTFDGQLAWVSGRNLGATYYQGFDEVALQPSSPFRDVPWLDVSARVEGPLVERIERAFLGDWQRAGGAPFPITTPPRAGESTCRLVLHEGLADTHTLDTQRALIDAAQRRLVLVNTFPLLLELQAALRRAVARGVQVQLLFGNVRPRWGEDQPFEGGVLRALGDDLVRSRFEPVLTAGAEGYEFALTPRPAWDPELRRVFPHVHAKLLVRDEADVAVGSANVDVTSAYWESEALLLVHDPAVARQTLATLDGLLGGSRRVDVAAPGWSDQHERRAWLGRHWPSLLS